MTNKNCSLEQATRRIQQLRDALESIIEPSRWWDNSHENALCIYCERTTGDRYYKWMAQEHEEDCPVYIATKALTTYSD